jgi:hypothetical protein
MEVCKLLPQVPRWRPNSEPNEVAAVPHLRHEQRETSSVRGADADLLIDAVQSLVGRPWRTLPAPRH